MKRKYRKKKKEKQEGTESCLKSRDSKTLRRNKMNREEEKQL